MNLVEGDPKAHFSIATTPSFKGGHYPIPWISPLTLDPYFIMLSAKQGSIKYHFLSLWCDLTCIEPQSPGPLANTLLIKPMDHLIV